MKRAHPKTRLTLLAAGAVSALACGCGSSNSVTPGFATFDLIGWIGELATQGGGCTGTVGVFNGGWCAGGTAQAGAGDGELSSPSSVFVDGAGSFYVADGANARLSKYKVSTGQYVGSVGRLTASAGTGATPCSGTGAAAGWCTGGTFGSGSGDGMLGTAITVTGDSSGNLYVTDAANNRVCLFTASSGAFKGCIGDLSATAGTCPATGAATGGWCTGGTFAAGTGDGQLTAPAGAVVAGSVGLVVSESGGNRLDLFSTAGVYQGSVGFVHAVAGTGATPCTLAGAAATRWCTGGSFLAGGGDGAFSAPGAVQADSAGYLYVADAGNFRVSRLTASTGLAEGSIGLVSAASGSTALACGAASAAPFFCTGGTFATGTGDGAFTAPAGLAVAAGMLYVTDSSLERIDQFTVAGAFQGAIGLVSGAAGTGANPCGTAGAAAASWCTGGTFAGGASDGELNAPTGLGTDAQGDLFVADGGNDRVYLLHP